MRQSVLLIHRKKTLSLLAVILTAGLLGLYLFAATLLPAGTASLRKGSWFDCLVSQAISKNYGCAVEIKNIRIRSLRTLSFDSATASSKEGKLLISTQEGFYRLERIRPRKNFSIEGALFVQEVAFSKEYYKRSRLISKPFRYLMNKPIRVKAMKVEIALGPHNTLFEVQECHSKDITINGRLTLRGHRIIEDKLSVACSPLMLLKNIF